MTNKTPLEMLEKRIEQEESRLGEFHTPEGVIVLVTQRPELIKQLKGLRSRYLADPENVDLVYEMLCWERGA